MHETELDLTPIISCLKSPEIALTFAVEYNKQTAKMPRLSCFLSQTTPLCLDWDN